MSVIFNWIARKFATILGVCLCLHGMADSEPRFLVNGTYYGPNVYWTVTLKAGTAGSLFDDTMGPVRTFRYETVVTVDGAEKLVVPGGTWSSNQGDSTYTAKIPLRDLGLLTPEACGTHYLVAFTRNYEGNSTVDTGYSMLYVDSYCTISMQNFIHLEATDGDYYDRVQVTWNEDQSGATYTLKREGVTIAADIKNTSYDDKDAVPGVKYKYQVVSSSGTESNEDEGYAMPPPPELGELTLIGVPVPANHVAVGKREDFLVAERKFDAEVKVIDLNSEFYSLKSSKLIGTPNGDVAKYEHIHTNGGLAFDLEGDDIIAFVQNTLKFGRGFHGEYSWRVEAVFVDVKGRPTERVSEIVEEPVFFRKYGKDDQATKNPNWFTYWKEDGACPCLENASKEVLVWAGFDGWGLYGTKGGVLDILFTSKKVYLNPNMAAEQHYADGPYKVISPQEYYFGGPYIWGIYTVEEVVAHELSHATLDDAYSGTWGEKIVGENLSWASDSDRHKPQEWCEGSVRLVVNGQMQAKPYRREYCDNLMDWQEGAYGVYKLDKNSTDTYNIAVAKNYSEYAAYGDDEFLAMIAANKATEEDRAKPKKDWAFPGEQSCIPQKVKKARDDIGWPQNRQKRSTAANPNARSVAMESLPSQNALQGTESTNPSVTINEMTREVERDDESGLVASVSYSFDMTVGGLHELRLSGVMTDLSSNVVAYANAVVSNGNVSAELRFSGNEIYESGKKGPFRLDGVKLVAFDGNDFSELATLSEFKDGEVDLRRGDFVRNDAYLLDVAKEIVTTNGIEVSVNAEINAMGDYEIFATLADTNGVKVASSCAIVDCVQGTNYINVVFATGDIHQSGVDGPYVIDNIALSRDGVRVDSRLDYYTLRKKYRAAAFDFDEAAEIDSDEFMSQFEDYTPPVDVPPPERFWVFFNSNGGSVSETTREIISGKMVGTLPVPTMGNDEFLGWFTELDGGTIVSDSTIITTNVMYHAHWKEVPDQIQFAVSELTVDENDTATISVVGGNADAASSVNIQLTYNTASVADLDLANGTIGGVKPEGGLRFPLTLSWEKGEVGEKVIAIPVKKDAVIENDESFTLRLENTSGMEMGDVSECAVTIVDATVAYTVTFDANEGNVAEATRRVAESTVIGTLPKPSRDGYSFLGWFTELDGGLPISSTTAVFGDVTYYAHWTDRIFARFADLELSVDEDDSMTVRVIGGNPDNASSVDVYLAYNTAAAADVDLAKGRLDGVTPKGGLKFPMTLKWAKGEVGEKVITIPAKTDKAVEGDEFFTLQLANAVGVELGEERTCTVTIKDANSHATLQDGILNQDIKATTKGTAPWFVAEGSPIDTEGLPKLFHAESPALDSGKSSMLSLGSVKGWGVLYFSVRFTGDPNEEAPSRIDVYSGTKHIGTIDHTQATNVWESFSITINGGSLTAAHAYSFDFIQGSDTDVHCEISNLYWDYLGNISPSSQYCVYAYPNTPDGGFVSGSGLYSYGDVFKLVAKPFPGWTFDGWYEAIHDDDTEGTEYFLWSKSATVSYRIDHDATVEAFFSKIPYICGLADPANAGKVTGSGYCAAGKKVTLKATANKGFVFTGWRDDAGVVVAQTQSLVVDRSAKPGSGSAASTTIVGVDGDVTYRAGFITVAEDKAAITLNVNGESLSGASDANPTSTNILAGVYLEWPVAASALSETKVKVAGLPAGLKFTDKPVTSKIGSGKTAVTVTNVLANTIYGVPSAASKIDTKTGAAKPSAVKFTVTTAGKSSQTYQIAMTVDALPAWAQGTFAGGLFNDGAHTSSDRLRSSLRSGDTGDRALPCGTVSLTIDAKGKIGGKALGDGLTYTLAAPYYAGFGLDENQSTNFLAYVTASWSCKEGTKTIKTNDVVQLVVKDNGIGGCAAADDWFEAYTVNWKVEPWKTLGKSLDKNTLTYAILSDGSFTEDEAVLMSALGAEVTARVTLKFAATGAVAIAGEFVMGYNEKTKKYNTVKATGSATLVPVDEEHGAVFIYLLPKGLAPHARCMEVPWAQE